MQLRDGLLGGVFVGDAPAREFAGVAELLLQIDAVDADDDAVDAVGQLAALGGEVFDELPDGVDRVALLGERIGGDAPGGEGGEEFAVGGEAGRRVISPRPWATMLRRRSATMRGVELLERAGRGVAGIGERFFAGCDDGVVHPLELGGGHVDFAADFEDARDRDISCARGA